MADFTWPIVIIEILGILALIILIGVLALWKTLKDKKRAHASGLPLDDERTQKLKWKAAYYAMFTCQYFILAYLWVTLIGGAFFDMPEIEAGYPLIAAVLVSIASFLLLRWHFGRKGEL